MCYLITIHIRCFRYITDRMTAAKDTIEIPTIIDPSATKNTLAVRGQSLWESQYARVAEALKLLRKL